MNCSLFFVRKVGLHISVYLSCRKVHGVVPHGRVFDLTEVHGYVLIDSADVAGLCPMQSQSVQHFDIRGPILPVFSPYDCCDFG